MSELTTDKALSFIADGLCDCMGTLEDSHTDGCPQDKVATQWFLKTQHRAMAQGYRLAADYLDTLDDKSMIFTDLGACYTSTWLRSCADKLEGKNV